MGNLTETDDLTLALIRDVAIANAGVKAFYKSRILISDQPKVKKPKYPSLHLDIIDGRNPLERSTDAQFMVMDVFAFSKNSYHQAKEGYNLFKALFHNERKSNSLLNLVMQQIVPAKKFFLTEQELFFYKGTWEVNSIRA